MGEVTTPDGPILGVPFFDDAAIAELSEFDIERVVEIVRPDIDGDVMLVEHPAGGFVGELHLLTGQRAYLTARGRLERGRSVHDYLAING